MFSQVCVKNSVHRWGVGVHAWQGACMAGDMCGRGHTWQGEEGVRGKGGVHDRGACVAGAACVGYYLVPVFYLTSIYILVLHIWKKEEKTRMRSSRMGGLPQCMLGYPPGLGLETPPGCGPGDPPGCGPGDPQPDPSTSPLGCGPRDQPWPDPSTFPLGVGLETCKACWDITPL